MSKESGFRPREGGKHKKNPAEDIEEQVPIHDPDFDALEKNLNEGTKLAEKQAAILKRYKNSESTRERNIRKAQEQTLVERERRAKAEQERTEEQKKHIEERLGIAKRTLKQSLKNRNEAGEKLVAPRLKRIEELRKELATWKRREAPTQVVRDTVPKRTEQREPKVIFDEIAALESEIQEIEEKYGKAYVPNKSTEHIKSGIYATDPVKSPETPKEMRESIAALTAAHALDSEAETAHDQVGELEGTEHFPQSDEEVPLELTQRVEKKVEPTSSGPIVMVNPVLTRQALGGSKRKYEEFMRRQGAPAPVQTPTEKKIEQGSVKANKLSSKKWWSIGGGGLTGIVAALGLAALTGGKETGAVQAPQAPTVGKTAAEAGVTHLPTARATDAPPMQIISKAAGLERVHDTKTERVLTYPTVRKHVSLTDEEFKLWGIRFRRWMKDRYPAGYVQADTEKVRRQMVKELQYPRGKVVGSTKAAFSSIESQPEPTPLPPEREKVAVTPLSEYRREIEEGAR